MPINSDQDDDKKKEAVEPVLRFISNIKRLRHHLGMDRKQMSEFLGYKTPGPYYRMEDYLDKDKRGTRYVHPPNISRMWALAQYLDFDFYELIAYELDFSKLNKVAYVMSIAKKSKSAVDEYGVNNKEKS